ncbi:helicase [Actinobacteria bacterium SCGC AG-212-D09]|nr:helicase [Actinobacteria bacterium SCGC AG-212-D09]
MAIIDNINNLLGDDLKATIGVASKLRIAASTFSIYAFEALREELTRIDSLDFIFTAPTFVADHATDPVRKERREFFIPQVRRESSLYGSEFEIRLRNKLTQRAVARECADWISTKAEFRSNRTGQPMQQFAVVDDAAVYVPLQGFTSADLGYERGDAVSNMVTRIDDPPATSQYLRLFDQIWHNTDQLQDVTEIVREHIASVYAENSPERVYFLILYNLFAEFLDDISDDVLPNDLTGYKDTEIWSRLYDFQKDAATGIINKLESYNGCILADSVGLGKTFTALAVIKYYELRNKSVLVLAPKKLADNWTNYNKNLTTNSLARDRLSYDVLAHTDLSRARGESMGIPLNRVNWGNYDLVVIDESHNFRNADYSDEGESRYQRLMRRVMQQGVKTKVLMLSATPVNNRFLDLRNQLALAYEGDSENLSAKLRVSTSIEQVFRQAQVAFKQWSGLPPAERTAESILALLDFDFFELLDAVTIARSRKHIQAFYDMTEVGAFPRRRQPITIREPLTDLPEAPSFSEIFEQLQGLTLAAYAPLAYVFPSRMEKYEELFNVEAEGSRGNLGHANRERGIQKLMTINLLKRLESSVEAFRLTLGRVDEAAGAALAAIDAHDSTLSDIAAAFADVDADDDDFEVPETATVGRRFEVSLADIDTESWRRDLANDRTILHALIDEMVLVTPQHDRKLQALRGRVLDKARNPINMGNRKVLIFSAFADTAAYLYRELAPAFTDVGLQMGIVTGKDTPKATLGKGYDFHEILTLFSPRSKERDLVMPQADEELDVLIGTDCISEGQNLQDCDCVINYDIHWNPVRIVQRFGRVDRIGSNNASIQLVNFWPDVSLDEYINLKERVENRMVIADLAATADDNLLTQQSSETAFRREQLRRLQEEVIELEDVRTGVSITDLGLNDFRMDLLAYVKEYGDLASSPKGLHAVIAADPDRGLRPGVVFALRSVADGAVVNKDNRLHPYYLVYLDDHGEVIADHTEVKALLDLIRQSCHGRTEPIPAVYRIFNEATAEGAQMEHYSELLTSAIGSLITVTEERDIDSLFASAQTTALTQRFTGLDDFELVAFLAVVDPKADA